MSATFPKLPKVMVQKEFCDCCYQEMEMADHVPNLTEQYVDFIYRCKCGHSITFRWSNKFFQTYFDALTAPPKIVNPS